MDFHTAALESVCRIGGRKFSSLSRPTHYPVNDFQLELKACFGIDVEQDELGVHPPSFCTICKRYMEKTAATLNASKPVTAGPSTCRTIVAGGCNDVQLWTPHPRTGSCGFCDSLKRAGRPGKRKRQVSPDEQVEMEIELSVPQPQVEVV